jgi:S1-C subfamily serine protease
MANDLRRPLITCSPFALLLALVALSGWAGWAWITSRQEVHDETASARPVVARGGLTSEEQARIELFRASAPSVVHITTRQVGYDRFQMRAMEFPRGTGSGFVWDERGYVVTNFHVLQGASRALVTLDGRDTYEAVAVGAEPTYDIAVLKIEAAPEALRPIPIGSSADLRIGQGAFAIGNPFGLDRTLSSGVISGLEREIESPSGSRIRGVIQVDASINPGNSGGPLLDSAGRLIGMNTAIASTTGNSAGIGFAVPVDAINRVVPSLIRMGRFDRPKLGVQAAAQEVGRFLGVEGVVVGDVVRGSGADRAGLRPMSVDERGFPTAADVITSVDGRAVRVLEDRWEVLEGHAPGDVVPIEVRRGSETLRLEVQLSQGV